MKISHRMLELSGQKSLKEEGDISILNDFMVVYGKAFSCGDGKGLTKEQSIRNCEIKRDSSFNKLNSYINDLSNGCQIDEDVTMSEIINEVKCLIKTAGIIRHNIEKEMTAPKEIKVMVTSPESSII